MNLEYICAVMALVILWLVYGRFKDRKRVRVLESNFSMLARILKSEEATKHLSREYIQKKYQGLIEGISEEEK